MRQSLESPFPGPLCLGTWNHYSPYDDDGNVDAVSVVLNTDRADAFYERVLGYIAYALDIGTADDVVSADGGELGGWYIWSSDTQGGGTAMHFIFSDKR